MSEASTDLNQATPNNDQMRNGKNADKSVGRLNKLNPAIKRRVRNVILAGLVLTPGIIHDTKVSAPNIKEPTPVSAPLPDFKSQSTDTLQPYTPQSAAEISPTVIQSPLLTHELEQDVITEDYIQQKLTSSLERFSLELKLTGIDFNKEATLDELEQIAKEAIPYLAEELNIERVNVPSIRKGGR